ncbi:unnamed protein product [Symbiodinium pilosum]|uniref:Uncharacterized protein n=1 Tax=Symbiodinium pilosum TaxID=2952 RepID=A0A812W775_SYMPI|nr:unnamed protein product [Symbiodinium pilosum]
MAGEVQKEASAFPSLASLWPFASDASAGATGEAAAETAPESRNAAVKPAEESPAVPSQKLGNTLRPPSSSDDAEAAASLPLPTSRSLRESAMSSTPQGSPSSRQGPAGYRESSGEPGSPGARLSSA